jgi:hypothetical protein
MAKNYEHIKNEFIDYLVDPSRTITQGEFAKLRGINPATLSEWKNNSEFKSKYMRRLDSYLADDIGPLYQKIKEMALRGDLGWARLYLQQFNLLRDYKELQKTEASADPLVIILDREKPVPILGGDSCKRLDDLK